jgi:hypothetical protein
VTVPNTEPKSIFSQLNQLVANRSWLGASRANLISRQKPQVGLRLRSRSALGFGPGVVEQIQLLPRPSGFGRVQG